MTGRHAKRTTVRRADIGWVVIFATFDQPSSGGAHSFEAAIALADRFEQIRARSAAIDATLAPAPRPLAPVITYPPRPVRAPLSVVPIPTPADEVELSRKGDAILADYLARFRERRSAWRRSMG